MNDLISRDAAIEALKKAEDKAVRISRRKLHSGCYKKFENRVVPGKQRKIMVHAAMVYGCKDCGSRWLMYLEKGLEEAGDPDRKPVPFGIMCPYCKGFHAYDISGCLKIPDEGYVELPKDASCFENLPDRDCGKPMISPYMKRLEDDEIPLARIFKDQ